MVVAVPLYFWLVIKNPYDLFGGMPSLVAIENPENDLSSEVISADGVSLGRYFRFNRSQISYDQLPKHLVQTLLISEDHRFFEHSGLDLWSYFRVLYGIVSFDLKGGGSTLSQQTAKNLFNTREEELQGRLASLGSPFKLVISKSKEWIIAVRLERNFTKEEILALYLNTVPFNHNAYGIKIAAETYFHKSVRDLNQQESALLVGMLQNPILFNPINYPENARKKRNEVLEKLLKHKVIRTKAEYDSLTALPVLTRFSVQNQNNGLATYFREVLKKDMLRWCKEQGYDLYESGLKIHTTIDSRMQQLGERAMQDHMKFLQAEFEKEWGVRKPWVDSNGNELKNFIDRKVKELPHYKTLQRRYDNNEDSIRIVLNRKRRMNIFDWKGEHEVMFSTMDSIEYYNRFLNVGLMAMDPRNGAIKVWIGGINHKHFKFDHVQQSRRQPGSTFKAFVYGKAMEDGYSPCDQLQDISPAIKTDGGVYHVKNAGGSYGDGTSYTLRRAMAKSLNSITMQLMQRLKPENVASFAQRLGIKSNIDPVYSLGLGTSDVSLHELVGAYSSFVNLGLYNEPFYITRIEDKHGNILATFTPTKKQVMHENTAYKMVYMLQGGVDEEGGSSRGLSFQVTDDNEVGGKTGTTNNASDTWYIGITHNLVTGVWVGGDERSVHFPSWSALGSGSRSALPLWDKFMQKVYKYPELGYPKGNFPQPQALDITLDCGASGTDTDFAPSTH
jgi:penicillin-binding protein 1A